MYEWLADYVRHYATNIVNYSIWRYFLIPALRKIDDKLRWYTRKWPDYGLRVRNCTKKSSFHHNKLTPFTKRRKNQSGEIY